MLKIQLLFGTIVGTRQGLFQARLSRLLVRAIGLGVLCLNTLPVLAQCYSFEGAGGTPLVYGYFPTVPEACALSDFPSCVSGGCANWVYTEGTLISGSLATNNAVYGCNLTVSSTGNSSFCSIHACGIAQTPNAITVPEQVATPCPEYFVQAIILMVETTCKNCVADPINPETGSVFETEDDVVFAGTPGSIAFRRFYNSGDSTGVDGVPGWRHSYDGFIATVYQSPPTIYPGQSSTVSPEYSTQAAACSQGFTTIQASVSAWAGATANYTGGACVISKPSGAIIATLPVLSAWLGIPSSTAIEYDVTREDGQFLRYPVESGVITNPPGISLRLAVTGSGFTLTDDQDNVETYNNAGVLQSITSRAGVVQTISYVNGLFSGATDSFGHSLSVTRNVQGSIASLTVSGGGIVQYGYSSPYTLALAAVTNMDGTTRSYDYGNTSFTSALTGLIDEAGNTYSTWGYNTQGQANSTAEFGGANQTTLVYNSNGSVTITDALGAVRTFSYTRIGDINRPVSISGSQCPTCQEMAATTYDAAGWVASRTDYNGNVTCYQNDPVRGLELVRVEGFAPGSTCPLNLTGYVAATGTLQRVITTQWSTTWREPVQITEPNRTTSFTYDANGNVLTKTVANEIAGLGYPPPYLDLYIQ